MNFFQSQDAARKNTKLLVLFFLTAVALLIVLTNLLVIGVVTFSQSPTITVTELKAQFNWNTFLLVGVGVVALVFLASLYKIIQLSGGGERVAEMMGGELIIDGGGDIHKKRVLNIVEEMSIASGTPVPPVYLIDDMAINAFAAGTTTGNAVIGVTRGTIKKLSRDQLQGVIAHEFSHIHNGDMRLNIRLIGLLNGILIIGTIGYFLLRSSTRRSHRRSSKGGGGGAVIVLGIGLMVIGYTGTFFGNIIKAAVSRQREYLADASAVQFTRNKDGIAGALKRIGGNSHGSIMQSSEAAEISHALFGEGVSTMFTGLFATHPPLDKRIRAIQPNWDGEFEVPPEIDPLTEAEQALEDHKTSDAKRDAFINGVVIMAGHTAISEEANNNLENAIDSIGQPSEENFEYAQQVIATLPEALKLAARNPYSARAVIYYLLLDKHPENRDQQLQYIKEKADTGIYEETLKLHDAIPELHPVYRLPLIEITLSTLRQLSVRQYFLFKDNLNALIEMDDKINLFEWSLHKIVFHHLESVFEKSKPPIQNKKLTSLKVECSILFSFLIHAGKQDGISAQDVFDRVKEKTGITEIELIPFKSLSMKKLNTALSRLNRVKPLSKPKLLKACATCITADKKITPTEAELFRAISDILDCPMPPLSI